jgi:hypothetical protein
VDDSAVANIPADAEDGDMIQPAKSDIDDIEFDVFDQYLSAEIAVNWDGNCKSNLASERQQWQSDW